MSSSEIQALFEQYIGRKFDADDSSALRDFLRDLQVQKVKKPAPEKDEPASTKFIPVSERKQNLPREVAKGDRPAPVSLVELGAHSGAKDRAANYVNAVSSNESHSLSAQRVAEELNPDAARVGERKAQWAHMGETVTTPKASNLDIDPSTPRAKDRMAAYNQTVQAGGSISKDELVAERLADVKGVAVKDRAGVWASGAAAGASTDPSLSTASRLEEVKGASGVKDRLGNWNKVMENAEKTPTSDPSKVQERLAELSGTGVKDRTQVWSKAEDTVVASTADPNLAAARTAELKTASSIKDRLGAYAQASSEKPIEKKEIHIPTDHSELPTKESQGQ